MRRGYIACADCGKEIILAAAKRRKKRCYECWQAHQLAALEKQHPYYALRSEQDLLDAAHASSPWILKTLGISLPAGFVRRDLRKQYRAYKAKLGPGERVWPFHFNQFSLAMRKGFLVVKDGKPDRVWITEMS